MREFDTTFIVQPEISEEGREALILKLRGVLERSGGWYSYKGEKIDNGREKCRGILRGKPSLAFKIENDIRAKLGVEPRPAPVPRPIAPSAVEKPAEKLAEATKAVAKHEDDKKPAKK